MRGGFQVFALFHEDIRQGHLEDGIAGIVEDAVSQDAQGLVIKPEVGIELAEFFIMFGRPEAGPEKRVCLDGVLISVDGVPIALGTDVTSRHFEVHGRVIGIEFGGLFHAMGARGILPYRPVDIVRFVEFVGLSAMRHAQGKGIHRVLRVQPCRPLEVDHRLLVIVIIHVDKGHAIKCAGVVGKHLGGLLELRHGLVDGFGRIKFHPFFDERIGLHFGIIASSRHKKHKNRHPAKHCAHCHDLPPSNPYTRQNRSREDNAPVCGIIQPGTHKI